MYSKLKCAFYFFVGLFLSCQHSEENGNDTSLNSLNSNSPSLIILGTLQDGGSPHAGCHKDCCKNLFEQPEVSRQVVSLGIVDRQNEQTFLIEATPDLPKQMKALKEYSGFKTSEVPDGIFLTHAHIGHYSGLQFLGKEVMNTSQVLVYAMPRMKSYLETNGPWSQLVNLKNISLLEIQNEIPTHLNTQVKITAIQVPHRDEFSETVGFVVEGPNKRILFIPDIDKWEKWEKKMEEEILKVDYACIDGTFYDEKEINNRNISEIPHPFVIESMERFKNLETSEKAKIYFIHFNHTNPLLDSTSEASKTLKKNGFNLAQKGQVFAL